MKESGRMGSVLVRESIVQVITCDVRNAILKNRRR